MKFWDLLLDASIASHWVLEPNPRTLLGKTHQWCLFMEGLEPQHDTQSTKTLPPHPLLQLGSNDKLQLPHALFLVTCWFTLLETPGMWPAVSRLPQVSPSLISLPPSSDQVGFSSLLVCPLLAWSWGFLSGHVWYLGLEDSFLWRGWLAHRKMFGRFLASTHQMQVGTPEWRTKNVFGHGQLSPGCKIVADGEHCSTYM